MSDAGLTAPRSHRCQLRSALAERGTIRGPGA